MKNVLVTGAAGFLGSHLMLHHLNNGDTVLGLDNYSSSKKNSTHIRSMRISDLTERMQLHEVDITNSKMINASISEFKRINSNKFDIIYNFACPASPPRYQEIPVETMMTCTVGTFNMLEVAKTNNCTLVHASTSEVYGDPNTSPQPETYKGNVNSYGPRSCYDEGKRAAEALCFDFFHKYNVDARLVRIFNTYGPNMQPNDGRVVSNFINQALRSEPLTLYGSGTQTRSFCYVDDLIRGIVLLGRLESNPHTPVNIGNPNEFTVRRLAEIVNELIHGDKTSNIIDLPLPVDDPTQRRPDITLAKKILGWQPEIFIEEGLVKTIEYFRNELTK